MASPAKNPRNRREPSAPDNRRERVDRRDPARKAGYEGAERRQGPRRKAELRRPLWQQPFAVLGAAALGVFAALYIDRVPGLRSDPAPVAAIAPSERPEAPVPSPPPEPTIDPEQLAAAQALRDEAERLTLAAVTLDEAAHERWLPRIARIEALRADPETPKALRVELDATVEALTSVGLL
ncbi:hypothetical protein ACNOYE_17885 [Nannocystaceae bacterium ST9]